MNAAMQHQLNAIPLEAARDFVRCNKDVAAPAAQIVIVRQMHPGRKYWTRILVFI
jgi:hypothetical protein